MFDSMRDNDELPFLEDLIAVAELHQQASLVDEKEFIAFFLEMPPEGSFEFCKCHLHAV